MQRSSSFKGAQTCLARGTLARADEKQSDVANESNPNSGL